MSEKPPPWPKWPPTIHVRRLIIKAALISLDGFRLGAAEQIRTYARIMGLPVRVAGDREEFRQAVELFEDQDRVLIDTSGRALNRPEERRELADMFADMYPIWRLCWYCPHSPRIGI